MREMRERDCVARLFVFCTFILMRRAFEMDLPTLRHPLSHFSKRDQKESHQKPQKKKKKKKKFDSFVVSRSLFIFYRRHI